MVDTDESPSAPPVQDTVTRTDIPENALKEENSQDDTNETTREAAPTTENRTENSTTETTTTTTTATPKAATPPKNKKPPYVHDPNKIALRFLFANRDGLSVIVKCNPSDTVGEVKGALISVWPEELPDCSGGDSLRLICMGKGVLMPDTQTLEDFQVPVFRTHPTPVNVAVRPQKASVDSSSRKAFGGGGSNSSGGGSGSGGGPVGQGCACILL